MKIEIITENDNIVSAKEYSINEEGWQRVRELSKEELNELGCNLIHAAWGHDD